ncbi:MAG: hypothetical protein QXT67_08935 [Candidatus Bathyarchaeia archaeon]
MSIKERIREKIRGPSLEDLIVDLTVYNREMARTRDNYKKRGEMLYERAKEYLIKGDEYRAKIYGQQYLNADRTAFALDMFVINMENLIFDLRNAVQVEEIGISLGKISKCLDRLKLVKAAGISQILKKVNAQMERMGVKFSVIMDQLKDYNPFNVEPVSDKDLDKLMDKMISEIIAEGTLPETRLSELQRRREALRGYGSQETK